MKEDTGISLGIAYLYAVIWAVFTLASYLLALFYSQIDKYSITAVLLQVVFFAAVLIVLYLCNRKQDQSFRAIAATTTIRQAMGAILMISVIRSLPAQVLSVISAVSSAVDKSNDMSVVPNFIAFALILCQIAVGAYLLKPTGRTDGRSAPKTVIGLAFWYTLLSAAFSLAQKLLRALIAHDSLDVYFLLWLGLELVILAVLWVLTKKQDQHLAAAFRDGTVRKTAGALLIVRGFLSIAGILNTIISVFWMGDSIGIGSYQFNLSITRSIVELIVVAGQIILGLYLLRPGRSPAEPHNG